MDAYSENDEKIIADNIKKSDAVTMKTVRTDRSAEEASLIPIYGTFSYGSFLSFKDPAAARELAAEGFEAEPAEMLEFEDIPESADMREQGSIIIENGIFRISPGLTTLNVAVNDSFKLLVDSVLK